MNTSGASGTVWQRGKFQKFFAQMKIRVGGSSVPVDIQQGDEFLFDGTVLKYGGSEFTSPQTRGAINAGWATAAQRGNGAVQNHSSVRSVAKAQTVNRDLSKVQRMEPESMGTDHSDEETVMQVGDRRPQNSGKKVLNVPNDKAQPRVMTASTVRGMHVNTEDLDPQEGVSVGRVRTAAKVKADLTTSAGQSVASRLSNISGSGLVREGITVTDTSNIREERARAERTGKVQKPVAKTVKVAADEGGNASKIKTARTIDPKFPEDWNFFAKLDDRIKLIKKNEKNRKFLLALFVVEGASVRAHLQKAYPKVVG